MFNSTMAPFDNQLKRIGDLFTGVLIDRLVSFNDECISLTDLYARYGSYVTNVYFMNLVEELRNGYRDLVLRLYSEGATRRRRDRSTTLDSSPRTVRARRSARQDPPARMLKADHCE